MFFLYKNYFYIPYIFRNYIYNANNIILKFCANEKNMNVSLISIKL